MATKKKTTTDARDALEKPTTSQPQLNSELSAVTVKSISNIEEKVEAIDWKLWEIYNIIKNYVESAPVGYVANAQQPQSSASDVAQELVKALNQGGGSEEKKSVVKKLFG